MNVVNINNYEPLQLRYCNVTTKSKLTTSDSITDYEKKNQPVKKKNFTWKKAENVDYISQSNNELFRRIRS